MHKFLWVFGWGNVQKIYSKYFRLLTCQSARKAKRQLKRISFFFILSKWSIFVSIMLYHFVLLVNISSSCYLFLFGRILMSKYSPKNSNIFYVYCGISTRLGSCVMVARYCYMQALGIDPGKWYFSLIFPS